MFSRPSKTRLGVRPGGRLGREELDFSGFLRAMEGGFIARPIPAVLWKRREFRLARELPGFSAVFSGVLHVARDIGYRAGVPKLPWLLVLRVATLVALAASAALLSDYTADTPSFCSAASGCGAVRASELSHVSLGDGKFLPLPLFGLAGFAMLYAASLASRRATLLAAAVGGAVGGFLLYTQAFVLHQFCWLCVTTDVSALVAAGAALLLRPSVWEDEAKARLRPWAWWALGAVAVAAPLTWPSVKKAPPVPGSVLALYQPSKINVIEFADFQCPACRRFSGILKEVLAGYGERVHFVRLNKPLLMHQYARDAAHAAVCAEAQHKAEPMADALFATDDLTPSGIDKVAASVGLEPTAFEACVLDPKTDARVERESAMLVPPELEGLPTTYIGGKRLLGVQSPETVADALERAARGEGATGISGYVYLPMVGLLGLLVLRFGSKRNEQGRFT
jgi:predicted DsbA family dithiol-disulfide isomerase/uncharacterized membrane protein